MTQIAEEPRDSLGGRPSTEEPGPASGDASTNPDGGPLPAKKERVLHTRVPAVLERELKRFADNLRVPVSNLVRTILEDALSVADAATENVEERLKKAAHQLEVEREKLKKKVMHDPLVGRLRVPGRDARPAGPVREVRPRAARRREGAPRAH